MRPYSRAASSSANSIVMRWPFSSTYEPSFAHAVAAMTARHSEITRRFMTGFSCRVAGSVERVAELLAELIGELIVSETLILRARMLDLERAHERGDATDGRPVHAAHDREDEARTIRIAAAGRIGYAPLVRGRDVVRFLRRVDQRAFR